LLVVVIAAKILLDMYFATRQGLAIRATGSNPRMARSQGVNTGAMVILGMAISNALVGLAGAMFVQTQAGADTSIGIRPIFIALALNSDFIGLQAQDLNLITAVLVVIALVIPLIKQRLTRRRYS